jgi:hypothetical protein
VPLSSLQAAQFASVSVKSASAPTLESPQAVLDAGLIAGGVLDREFAVGTLAGTLLRVGKEPPGNRFAL